MKEGIEGKVKQKNHTIRELSKGAAAPRVWGQESVIESSKLILRNDANPSK